VKIAITGATGFVGTAVTTAALERGDEVLILTRRPDAVSRRPEVTVQHWGESGSAALPAHDALVHLASETVAGEWTDEKRRKIVESRRDGTRRLVDALAVMPDTERPRVLVSASGIGYYGDEGSDAPVTEESPAGTGFMAEICQAWEAEVRRAAGLGMRAVSLRLGVVLGAGGGILERVLPRFRQGQGGPLGEPRRWFPWIHRADVAGLFLFAVNNPQLNGPVNAVSPGIVRALDFARALAQAVGQPLAGAPPTPSGPPGGAVGAPGGGPPRAAGGPGTGGPASALMASHHVLPRAAQAAGFVFRFPELAEALAEIVGSESTGRGSASGTLA
jgi:uncharacterized protein (TIGR01777 family)